MLIMIDGIDGSGKSTVIQAWKDYLTEQGNPIFDLKNYFIETGKYPDLSEVKSYDFVFGCEPTYTGVGKVIREELIKNGNGYPPRAIAEAYSLDRLVLYKKINIPVLNDNKIIIQDRGVCSSLAYQPVHHAELNFDNISALPGNQLALEHRPDYLVLMNIRPEEAIKRLESRSDKSDDAIFEKLEFMKKLAENYQSTAYQNIFTSRGTKIVFLNAEVEIDIMKQEAINLLKSLIK